MSQALNEPRLKLPNVIRELWKAQQDLKRHYARTDLKFTLDGRLVGDVAEEGATVDLRKTNLAAWV